MEHAHKRLPVYDERVDRIVGTLNVLDLLLEDPGKPIEPFVRRAHFIPGSISVHSADILSGEADLEPYRERGMILYCSNGARSRRSTLYLSREGFKKIFVLEGMIRNWRFSGYPLESSLPEQPAEEGAEPE